MVTHKNCYSLLLNSDDSTGLSAEGIAGRVLLIVTEVIALLVLVAVIALILCVLYDGKPLPVYSETPLFQTP